MNIDDDDDWADYARRLGIELNRARHRAGLTQEKLALAQALGVTLEELLPDDVPDLTEGT